MSPKTVSVTWVTVPSGWNVRTSLCARAVANTAGSVGGDFGTVYIPGPTSSSGALTATEVVDIVTSPSESVCTVQEIWYGSGFGGHDGWSGVSTPRPTKTSQV
ncbi:MAG: hypothetical protein ACJ72E_15275 [Marmoricola sp.]